MAHINETAKAIQEMVRFFLPLCADQTPLRELDTMASVVDPFLCTILEAIRCTEPRNCPSL
jgi:hypothetical protein